MKEMFKISLDDVQDEYSALSKEDSALYSNPIAIFKGQLERKFETTWPEIQRVIKVSEETHSSGINYE